MIGMKEKSIRLKFMSTKPDWSKAAMTIVYDNCWTPSRASLLVECLRNTRPADIVNIGRYPGTATNLMADRMAKMPVWVKAEIVLHTPKYARFLGELPPELEAMRVLVQ